MKDIIWEYEQDGKAIELDFNKKKIEARKNWLRHFEPANYLDQKEKLIKYIDLSTTSLFCFQWLVHFSGQYLRAQVVRTYTVDNNLYDLYDIHVPQ
ncbi:hypothetical protein RHMOL_Rhmol10G0167100 [Rhododendron molle]|uniref:Uncharacterized protein n=1 Tax=Rhododendron molle TaxID=49168 RepID=A0ACC0M318_RHOML|nr:hypothetical protein RHMOL_Rhmol10G0167100 [Rhododendron molle]